MNSVRAVARACLAAALLVAGCGGGGGDSSTSSSQTPADFDFGDNNPRKVTAFGDSITQGVLELRRRDSLSTRNHYPALLQGRLQSLDPAWRVVNRGVGGEDTFQGLRRLPSVLALDKSGFVIILEGTNDASECRPHDRVADNLMNMARMVKANHAIPILGTIPPIFRNDPCAKSLVDQVNALLRPFAQAEQIILADVFNGMNDRSLFGLAPHRDPLHPNERGYAVLADIFFTSMLEAVPGGVTTALRKRH